MEVNKRGEDFYEVSSESSARFYVVTWGTEGEFWSCNCTSYAIGRNKAGGMGHPFNCKHIKALDAHLGGTATDAVAQKLLAMAEDLVAKDDPNYTPPLSAEERVQAALAGMVADLESKK